jgi:hypothetical protein
MLTQVKHQHRIGLHLRFILAGQPANPTESEKEENDGKYHQRQQGGKEYLKKTAHKPVYN